MDKIQIGELLNLIADLISIPIILYVLSNKNLPRYYLFLIALIFLILSHFFTIIESFFFEIFFNYLEHLFIIFSGIFFLIGILKYFIKSEKKQ